jgi:hypothetical protein
MISAVHQLCVHSCASLNIFSEGETVSGLFKKLQSANAPIEYMVRQSSSRKSRSSWHQALRLSQPTDLVKKTTPDTFFSLGSCAHIYLELTIAT